MSKYLLKFVLNTNRSSKLIVGSLQFLKDDELINEYKATSSYKGFQYDGSWNQKGGLSPPTEVLKQRRGANSFYEVNTTPIKMPNVKGVNGDFFQILPFSTIMSNGVERGDFGVHRDYWNKQQGFPENIPMSGAGTLGCIGFQTGRGEAAFKRDINKIKKEGVKSIELIVKYT
jgi:hypothetical protein